MPLQGHTIFALPTAHWALDWLTLKMLMNIMLLSFPITGNTFVETFLAKIALVNRTFNIYKGRNNLFWK